MLLAPIPLRDPLRTTLRGRAYFLETNPKCLLSDILQPLAKLGSGYLEESVEVVRYLQGFHRAGVYSISVVQAKVYTSTFRYCYNIAPASSQDTPRINARPPRINDCTFGNTSTHPRV